jgi:hypothetical protein
MNDYKLIYRSPESAGASAARYFEDLYFKRHAHDE